MLLFLYRLLVESCKAVYSYRVAFRILKQIERKNLKHCNVMYNIPSRDVKQLPKWFGRMERVCRDMH